MTYPHGTFSAYNKDGCRCSMCSGHVSAYNAERIERVRQAVAAAKDVPCADCGGRFPKPCMDFDHRDPAQKSFTVSGGMPRGLASVLREIAKCDVICANCHRLRTETQRSAGMFPYGRPRKEAR